ncbi:MAG TPA: hypothetical protein VFU71_19880 [Burkholderiaceae bacterium]|nr:hypothetical protein [Burkholderiaceae bacterium]
MSEVEVGVARAMPREWFGLSAMRATALTLACAVAIGLAGCGGGADLEGDGFSVGVTIDGRPYGGAVASGAQQDVSIYAGQSVAFDASEPVEWILYAGNAAIPADGSTVFYGGASVRATAVSNSRIVVDTAASGPLAQAVPITLTATSTVDAALVATINVFIF